MKYLDIQGMFLFTAIVKIIKIKSILADKDLFWL